MPTCKQLQNVNDNSEQYAVNSDDEDNSSEVEQNEEIDISDTVDHVGKKSRKDQLTTKEANNNRLVTKVIIHINTLYFK